MAKKSIHYGLPYKGSKNLIAKWVCDNLPTADNFYDLFCGGCAITHYAMLSGKYKTYTINDIDWKPVELFVNAIHGKYADETRWISREDFYRLKDTDPYVALCWSFGNNGRNYLYGKDIEPYKKAMHYAIVLRDYSLIDTYDKRIKNYIDAPTIHERRINYRKDYGVMYKILPSATLLKDLPYKYTAKCKPTNSVALKSNVNKFLHLDKDCKQEALQELDVLNRDVHIECLERLQSLESLQSLNQLKRLQGLESLQHLEHLERFQRLQHLERVQSLQNLESLESNIGDYQNIQIKDNSVIYCDIPYKGTNKYSTDFDYERFYSWALKQTELVVISEYSMPDDFICIAQREKRVTLSSYNNSITKTEKLFVPANQLEMYRKSLLAITK